MRARTHCCRGHALEGNNIGLRADGTRWCRVCDAMRRSHRTTLVQPQRPWTTKELALLVELYPTTPTAELATRLGRSPAVVRTYASRRGISKLKEEKTHGT